MFHDKSKPTDVSKKNPDLVKFHDTFQRLCGVRVPTSFEDYSKAREALLDGVLDFLLDLHAHALKLVAAEPQSEV